ncbi:MAG: SDR family oxidoreductase [Hyphomicrobiaceae bacterium]
MSRLFCFGLGYSATALAGRLAGEGWQVSATATTPAGAERIAALGYEAFVFDGTARDPGIAKALSEATHVVVSAPPGAAGDPVLRRFGEDLAASPSALWIGYLSTIGVYGDWQGTWIDETCELKPGSERSIRRAAAEADWLELGARTGKWVIVFRLAGIYGPGRSAIDNMREGSARRIVKAGQVFNRIHRDDIAGVVMAAIKGTPQHAIYNVCDDEPGPPQDVVAFAAELLGVAVPPEVPFEQAVLSPMGASFYAENKRASNARAKGDLGWRLQYPSYREGLTAIAKALGR